MFFVVLLHHGADSVMLVCNNLWTKRMIFIYSIISLYLEEPVNL